MADIELVIKIQEEEFRNIFRTGKASFCVVNAIETGTLLRRGHGRLIDAKEFEAYIKDGFQDLKGLFETEKYRNLSEHLTENFLMDIQEQETVVPEDKESENADCD